ncbi:XRE family transcriptional regulator [Siminovitchia terrae]|uniref:XRE family transcriptional regulator n=1 Tax=Siminovitchia terrae TaxID=1914933 RepID=A0A429X2D0_SIMTE|nr:helix-turn-helix transcriptional regulator [Siminovitchia terrae]RST57631.1 XRE family transcriptional regulator [Siminovitchia terrae]
MRRNLRQQRVAKGYTDVEKFSKKIGISASYYYKIEQGKRTPGIILAKKIADTLNQTVDEIFFEEQLDDSSKTKQAI